MRAIVKGKFHWTITLHVHGHLQICDVIKQGEFYVDEIDFSIHIPPALADNYTPEQDSSILCGVQGNYVSEVFGNALL